jgi:hypothetical protein
MNRGRAKMSVERQRKIELLVRQNEARREHPYYLTELSHVLKHAITEDELFDLETTDKLFSQSMDASKHSRSILQKTWPLQPNSVWIRVCFCLAEHLGCEPVVLFVGPYNLCGAIKTRAEYPLVNAAAILEFDKDTVSIQSLNSDGGLYLDLYEENAAWWIELKVWGNWCSRAKKCFPSGEGDKTDD